jgi:AraC-like DNA-binding protein
LNTNGHPSRGRVLRELPCTTAVKLRREYFLVGSWVQPEYVFTCPDIGRSYYRMERRRYVMERGMLSLMPPYMLHVVRPIDRVFSKFVAHFTLDGHSASIAGLPPVIRVPDETHERVLLRFRDMLAAWLERRPGFETIVGGLMAEFLGLYIQHAGEEAEHESDATKAWKGLENSVLFMRENHHRDLSLPEIAARAGLTPSYFGQIFRHYIGLAPHAFLNNCRIEAAKRLLVNDGLSCTEVAERVGFQTIHAFSKVFKRHTGHSPTEWLRTRVPWRGERREPTANENGQINEHSSKYSVPIRG